MFSKCIILSILFLIDKIRAFQENKNDEINITSCRDHLKKDLGCVPLEKWSSMELSNNAVDVVCMSKDYKVGNEPKEIGMNPILMIFKESTIVDMDEKKKTITMDFQLLSLWRDERIKAIFSKGLGIITLPPVTTEDKPIIWNPFLELEIRSLKERRYILDPVVSKMGLYSSNIANNILKRASEVTFFPANSSVVWSKIYWRATVSCSFNFSNFPFDRQKCHVRMSLPFNWNLTLHNNKFYTTRYDADGFYISVHKFGPSKHYQEQLARYTTRFGIVIDAKRQISKYGFQYCLPSITIVMASSVSFIIPVSKIPGRVALVVTQFLTLTNIFIHQMVHTSNLSKHYINV